MLRASVRKSGPTEHTREPGRRRSLWIPHVSSIKVPKLSTPPARYMAAKQANSPSHLQPSEPEPPEERPRAARHASVAARTTGASTGANRRGSNVSRTREAHRQRPVGNTGQRPHRPSTTRRWPPTSPPRPACYGTGPRSPRQQGFEDDELERDGSGFPEEDPGRFQP